MAPGRRAGLAPSCSRWLPAARPLAAAGAGPAARARRRGRRCRRASSAGRATPTAAARLRDLADAADRADRGAGAAGRRGRARRARRPPRRSPRTTGSSPGPPSGWCWSRAASTRSRWSCRRPATWRCGAAYESNLRGYRDGGAGRACTPGCCTPPRRTPQGAEASPLRRLTAETGARTCRAAPELARTRGAAADT